MNLFGFLQTQYVCPYCGIQTDNEICCKHCKKDLQKLVNDCVGHTPWCDYYTAPFYYNDIVREAICRFKFHDHLEYLDPLANVMALCVRETADLVIPVPIYEEERKYNVAEMLAKALAQRTGQHYHSHVVTKIRNTQCQHELSLEGKFRNLSGCYKASEKKLKGKTVLICDDIITSGNTINEMARTCKQAGARRVLALAIAISELAFEMDFSSFY